MVEIDKNQAGDGFKKQLNYILRIKDSMMIKENYSNNKSCKSCESHTFDYVFNTI